MSLYALLCPNRYCCTRLTVHERCVARVVGVMRTLRSHTLCAHNYDCLPQQRSHTVSTNVRETSRHVLMNVPGIEDNIWGIVEDCC